MDVFVNLCCFQQRRKAHLCLEEVTVWRGSFQHALGGLFHATSYTSFGPLLYLNISVLVQASFSLQ